MYPAAEWELEAEERDGPTPSCVRCRTNHRVGLCDRLIAAALSRLDWIRASSDKGEYGRFSFVDLQLQMRTLARLRGGLQPWRRIESDAAFDRFAAAAGPATTQDSR